MSKTTLEEMEIVRVQDSISKTLFGESLELRIRWSNDFNHRVALNEDDTPKTVSSKLMWLANAILLSQRNGKL